MLIELNRSELELLLNVCDSHLENLYSEPKRMKSKAKSYYVNLHERIAAVSGVMANLKYASDQKSEEKSNSSN